MPSSQDCTCPHIDKGDRRCADRLTIGGLEMAFEVCVSGWNACPHYHRINLEESFQVRVEAGDPSAALWYSTLHQAAAANPGVQAPSRVRHAV
ncbi:MAG: hypothetical protein O2819_08275 [Planctomycetota bacterium]|nr:hypothetical protein [Planctomycetota bacterium]MDA1106659.1 hypothetical protein [Planctomycetota bacterium]